MVMSDKDTLLPGGKGVWIPIDHGVSDFPVKGLENLDMLIEQISHADAIVAQKGVVSHYASDGPNFVAHLSVSTRHAGKRDSDKMPIAKFLPLISGFSQRYYLGSIQRFLPTVA